MVGALLMGFGLAMVNGFVAPLSTLHQMPVQPAFAVARPALRSAMPTATLAYTGAETAGRVMRYLKGAGVSPERVPCGDGEDEECYALCDTEGCSVVGEVRTFWHTLQHTLCILVSCALDRSGCDCSHRSAS